MKSWWIMPAMPSVYARMVTHLQWAEVDGAFRASGNTIHTVIMMLHPGEELCLGHLAVRKTAIRAAHGFIQGPLLLPVGKTDEPR